MHHVDDVVMLTFLFLFAPAGGLLMDLYPLHCLVFACFCVHTQPPVSKTALKLQHSARVRSSCCSGGIFFFTAAGLLMAQLLYIF